MSGLLKKVFKMKSPHDALADSIMGKDGKPVAEDGKTEPMIPDHDTLQRLARRKAAKRTGGRASTILSEDRLGP